MRQLLRLLTALMLLFGLYTLIDAQSRGSTKFSSSLEETPQNVDWNISKTNIKTNNEPTEPHRFQVSQRTPSTVRRVRGRTRSSDSNVITTTSATAPSMPAENVKKVQIIRVRGRSRTKQPNMNTSNMDNIMDEFSTPRKLNAVRVLRKKVYPGDIQQNQIVTQENNSDVQKQQSIPSSRRTSVVYRDSLVSTTSRSIPLKDEPQIGPVQSTENGRRYRVRVIHGNAIPNDTRTIKNVSTDTPVESVYATRTDVGLKLRKKRPEPIQNSQNVAAIEEQNYPEHFKVLLKSKKPTEPKDQINFDLPRKTFAPYAATIQTTIPEEKLTTLRPAYKHKKVMRPNLKILFPSLQTTLTTTTIQSEDQDELKIKESFIKKIPSENLIVPNVEMIETIETTTRKLLPVTKFSSKIRMLDRSTVSGARTMETNNDTSPSGPTFQRLSAPSPDDLPKFSARYKNGEMFKAQNSYRKTIGRDKPFYTPTTPPFTTQSINWDDSEVTASGFQYNEIEPIHSGLIQNKPLAVETSHHSSSVTVSIFGALSEILSHTTESLSFLTSSTTERTPMSHTHSTPLSTDSPLFDSNENLGSQIETAPPSPIYIPAKSTTTKATTTTTSSNPITYNTLIDASDINDEATLTPIRPISISPNDQVQEFISETSTVPSIVSFLSSMHLNSTHNTNESIRITDERHNSSVNQSENSNRSEKSAPFPQFINNELNTNSFQLPITNPIQTTPLIKRATTNSITTQLPSNEMTTIEYEQKTNSMPNLSESSVEFDTYSTTDVSVNTFNSLNSFSSSDVPHIIIPSNKIKINKTITEAQLNLNKTNLPINITNTQLLTTQSPPNKMTEIHFDETTTEIRPTTIPDEKRSSTSIPSPNSQSKNSIVSPTTPSIVNIFEFKSKRVTALVEPYAPTESLRPIYMRTESLINLNAIDTTTNAQTKMIITPTMKSSHSENASNYMPRFITRIPILPLGFYGNGMATTNEPLASTLSIAQVSNTTTPIPISLSTDTIPPKKSRRFDFVVYGILPNNTVIRKYPDDIFDSDVTEDPSVVYGILPNKTIIRKYPNGTTVIDSKRNSRTFEVTDIDPKSLFNPNSEVYRKQWSTEMSTTPMQPTNSKHLQYSSKTKSTSLNNNKNNNNQIHINKNLLIGLNGINENLINITNITSNMNTNTITTTSLPSTYNNVNINATTTTTTTTTTSTVATMSSENLDEYLRKVNKSQIHTKSENVFSIAPPRSSNTFGSKKYRPISLDDYDSLPSSNEILSNEPSTTTRSKDSWSTITKSTSFGFDDETENDIDNNDSLEMMTSPKSGRQYITSFTTTTSTTSRPDLSKGVEIIRSLVEQARSTPPVPTGAVQSLTTLKSNILMKENMPGRKHRPMETTTFIPVNHRPLPMVTTTATTTTTRRVPNRQQTSEISDSFEIDQTTIRAAIKSTTINKGITATTRGQSMRNSLERKITSTTEPPPIDINDIADLLNNIPTTTKRIKATTKTTTTARPKTTHTQEDDLDFLRQVQRLLQRPTSTRMPIQLKSTTTTSTTQKPSSNFAYRSTSTFDDLLNSFQQVPTTTTRRPQLTTFSDVDDVAFLKGLRQIAISDATTKTTKNPDFANKIIQLAINRTGKSKPSAESANEIVSLSTDTENDKPSRDELEKNKQDVKALNNDLKLLSTLLGRPISEADLPKLTQQGHNQKSNSATRPPQTTTTYRTTKLATTTIDSARIREVELLQAALLQKQQQTNNQQSQSESNNFYVPAPSAPESGNAYGKTNDALLATLLKQRGIGPAHNNLPVDLYPSTTTQRPRIPFPVRSQRPILDGLAWLWRTWQDTSPASQGPTAMRTRTRGLPSNDGVRQQNLVHDQDGHLAFDEGLDSDTSSQPLDQSHTNEHAGSGFGSALPGGPLLSAALGVTRAVTQFLGAALQGAGKSIQSAWATQGSGGSNYYRLSGR